MCWRLAVSFTVVLVALFGFSIAEAGDIGPGTILYYGFDGTEGNDLPGSLPDDTGTYTATIIPGSDADSAIRYAAANPAYNPFGTSAEFYNDDWSNYAGDTLLIPDSGGLDFSSFDEFTVELFIRPDSSGSGETRRIFSEYIYAYMYLDAGNTLHAIRKWGPGGWTENWTHLAMDNFPLDTWSHAAMTWDGDAAGDKFKLYIDGELYAGAAGTSTATIDSSAGFAIGGYQRENSSTAQFFQGRIDEFRLSDVALEPDQFVNGDPWPRVQFSASDSSAVESRGSAEVLVILNKPFPDTVTVEYAVTGGSAVGGGTDYSLTAGTLMFEPTQTTPESISISITDDSLPEDDETIILTLLNPVDANLGYPSEHTFFILDDDTIPEVEFESTQSANPENVTPAKIAVILSRTFKDSVTVGYAVSGGSATGGGVDYNLEDGALTFDPCETSKDIIVEVISDGLGEGDESIEISLSNPVNAVLGGKDEHVYTILDGFINSVGMEFASIEPGTYAMGSENGDFDEEPVHSVTIGQPFYMSVHEVTNAQYEQFDANHAFIDHRGFSHRPDEAVIFVSWEDANAFCTWLSEKEGLSYRLPTEAEWEYACRAGSTAEYFTGGTLDEAYYNMRNQTNTTGPDPQPLDVGTALPNAFGLYDMHGNVEEWCYDWYGPYDCNDRTDPIQLNDTGVKVCRGGSHSTPVYFLRSANRMGTVPDDGHWLIGFRVVLGELPTGEALPAPPLQRYQMNVSQQIPPDISDGPDPDVPYFYGPRKYVHIPSELSGGPLYTEHNHVPGIVECPNGDLLAIWYSTIGERDRLLNVAGSRLRYGQDEWEEASVFWNGPDRNDHCPQLWLDENTNTIHHFNGLADAYSWSYLATVMRTSTDNGVTWSRPRLIMSEHDYRHMPVETIFRASNGSIVLPCDAVPGGSGGTALWISPDDGLTWYDAGGNIAGIHAGVAELTDGRLLAFGRGDNIDDMMPKSISFDMGASWTYSASIFPPIGSAKRLVLLRLKEGPLFFASFGSNGLFGTVSYDDGQTWTSQRLITDDGPGRPVETLDGTIFTMSIDNAEPKGYLSVCQGVNGVIHLISSRQHYAFNLKYIDSNYTPCLVDFEDLRLLSDHWLDTSPVCPADLDGTGRVDLADYSILAGFWQKECPHNWPLE